MRRMRLLAAVVVVLMAVCSGAEDDWPGFRGLGKDGRVDSAEMPLNWGPSHNVRWKTSIPGRGHSSPIISGDAVYVTTAYERINSSLLQGLAKHAMFVLVVLSVLTGIRCIVQNLHDGYGGSCRISQTCEKSHICSGPFWPRINRALWSTAPQSGGRFNSRVDDFNYRGTVLPRAGVAVYVPEIEATTGNKCFVCHDYSRCLSRALGQRASVCS